jgi:predicted permease
MIYLVALIRLIAFPLVGIAVFVFLPLPVSTITCVICSLAMPLGLNTIVIPSAYGKDTSKAAGMAIVSHLLSCITIPLMLMLMTALL